MPLMIKRDRLETVVGSDDGEIRSGGPFLDSLITGDEICVQLTTLETRQDIMSWNHPS